MHVLLIKSKHRSQEQLMCDKGKPSGSIACMEKITASVLLKLVIRAMKDATPLTPPSA